MDQNKIDQIERALEDCEQALSARNSPYSDWEEEFLESILEQWPEKQWLSEKQWEILSRLWDKS